MRTKGDIRSTHHPSSSNTPRTSGASRAAGRLVKALTSRPEPASYLVAVTTAAAAAGATAAASSTSRDATT